MEFVEFLEFLVRLAHRIEKDNDRPIHLKLDSQIFNYLLLISQKKAVFEDDDDYYPDD